MLAAIALILLCQLAGELVAVGLALPVPGPVLGMALLATVLALLRRIPAPVDAAADGLLRAMPLFFIPAGVGVLALGDTFRQAWLPIVVALVGSTAFALAVTALVAGGALALSRRLRGRRR